MLSRPKWPTGTETDLKFLLLVIDGSEALEGTATQSEIAAIDAFNEKLQASGKWITALGITHGSQAMVIDNRGGIGKVDAGSIHNDSEHYSGFWLIEAEHLEEAKSLALEASKACNRKVEVRSSQMN
jgi:hypothetical protein